MLAAWSPRKLRSSLNLQVYTNREVGQDQGTASAEAGRNSPASGVELSRRIDRYLIGIVQK